MENYPKQLTSIEQRTEPDRQKNTFGKKVW